MWMRPISANRVQILGGAPLAPSGWVAYKPVAKVGQDGILPYVPRLTGANWTHYNSFLAPGFWCWKADAMSQVIFTLDPEQIEFLRQHRTYGYTDQSAMVRAALALFQRMLEEEGLHESANRYADLFEEDAELQELTAYAVVTWPE